MNVQIDKVLTSWMVANRADKDSKMRKDLKIIWNEEYLACSFHLGSEEEVIFISDSLIFHYKY